MKARDKKIFKTKKKKKRKRTNSINNMSMSKLPLLSLNPLNLGIPQPPGMKKAIEKQGGSHQGSQTSVSRHVVLCVALVLPFFLFSRLATSAKRGTSWGCFCDKFMDSWNMF